MKQLFFSVFIFLNLNASAQKHLHRKGWYHSDTYTIKSSQLIADNKYEVKLKGMRGIFVLENLPGKNNLVKDSNIVIIQLKKSNGYVNR